MEWINFEELAPRENELVLCLRIDGNKKQYLLGEFKSCKYSNRDYYFEEWNTSNIVDVESNPIDYWTSIPTKE